GAIRGAGANFGVVTRFQFKAAPLGECFGGMFIIPATPETVRRFIELSARAPEELSTIANVMTAPPMPFVPAETHGKLVIFALVLYAWPAKDGERTLSPRRQIAAPPVALVDAIRYQTI